MAGKLMNAVKSAGLYAGVAAFIFLNINVYDNYSSCSPTKSRSSESRIERRFDGPFSCVEYKSDGDRLEVITSTRAFPLFYDSKSMTDEDGDGVADQIHRFNIVYPAISSEEYLLSRREDYKDNLAEFQKADAELASAREELGWLR